MREFISTGITVKDCLSANYGNGYCFQKFGYVFRKILRIFIRRFQNVYFNNFMRIQSIGQGFQKIVRNAALTDLGNGGKICRNRFQYPLLLRCAGTL